MQVHKQNAPCVFENSGIPLYSYIISIVNLGYITFSSIFLHVASPEICRIPFVLRQIFHYDPKYSKVVKSIKFIELTCESMPQLVFTCYIQAYLGPSEELFDNIKTFTSLGLSFLAICIGIMDVVHTGIIHKWHFSLEWDFLFIIASFVSTVVLLPRSLYSGRVCVHFIFYGYMFVSMFSCPYCFYVYVCSFFWDSCAFSCLWFCLCLCAC